MYSYRADAGWFVDCATGDRLAVAQVADNATLETAYGSAGPAPGASLLATLDGHVEMREPMEGPARPMLIVERFVSIEPSGTCDEASAGVALENTYWKLVRVGAKAVADAQKQREAHLVLHPDRQRTAGSGGCNRFSGHYTAHADKLTFGPITGTKMACTDGMDYESAFYDALARVTGWRILGIELELLDAAGEPVAQFVARPMP